jgi:hypothetical protein
VPKGAPHAPAPQAAPAALTQLPFTGADPWLVGLIGVAFLMCGAGLRLRLRLRPAGPRQSG